MLDFLGVFERKVDSAAWNILAKSNWQNTLLKIHNVLDTTVSDTPEDLICY